MNSHAITQAYKPLLIFTVLLITFCSLGLQKKPPAKPKATPRMYTIAIRGFEFVPATLTINAGDTVEWKNEDIMPHTATSDTKGFDSKSIESKAVWKSVISKPGDYAYHCDFHPTMKAKLMVK